MIDLITHLIAFAVGCLTAGAYAGFKISQRQTARRDFAAELRNPIDLFPVDFAREDWR